MKVWVEKRKMPTSQASLPAATPSARAKRVALRLQQNPDSASSRVPDCHHHQAALGPLHTCPALAAIKHFLKCKLSKPFLA